LLSIDVCARHAFDAFCADDFDSGSIHLRLIDGLGAVFTLLDLGD
jgi:hypothetical protein